MNPSIRRPLNLIIFFFTLGFLKPLWSDNIHTEFKLGYFYFGDSKLRHIYHQDALDYQFSISSRLWEGIRWELDLNYISKKGRSTGGHYPTHIRIVPLSLGLQGLLNLSHDVQWYASIGPRYFWVFQTNRFQGIDRHVHASGLGGFISSGILLYPIQDVFIDLYGSYSYGRLSFTSHKQNIVGHQRQVGGLSVGGALGYNF
jgi:hypothetical protein